MKNVLYIGNKLSNKGKNPTGIETLGPLLEAGGYHLRYASSQSSKLLRLLAMVFQTIRSARWADVVLVDTYSTSNFWYAVLVSQICQFMRVPFIPILHGGNLPTRLSSNPALCRAVFGKAMVCVAPSRYLHSHFSKAGFQVLHIPNPVDTEAFPFSSRNSVSVKLIWVRSLAELYNPMMALRTLQSLSADFPQASLLMVGPDVGLQTELQQFVSDHNLNVTFTGKLSKADWAQKATSADIFLNTSTVDNAPFSVIEALSLGLFVVSTDVGGIPFLVRDGHEAMLVKSNDHLAMADAVRSLIADTDLRKSLQQGATQLVAKSSSQAVLSAWQQILR